MQQRLRRRIYRVFVSADFGFATVFPPYQKFLPTALGLTKPFTLLCLEFLNLMVIIFQKFGQFLKYSQTSLFKIDQVDLKWVNIDGGIATT